MAIASPQPDSTRPYRGRPLARAASDPRNSEAALAWQTACTRPTRCWSRCSADQSASPVAAAGTVTAIPAPISMRAARSVPRNRSSRTAEVQQPSGSRTSAGWAGWPNGTPCSASVLGPVGRARTTPADSRRTTGSSACACSTRSARAAGFRVQLDLRCLPTRRAGATDGGTFSAYPPTAVPYPAVPGSVPSFGRTGRAARSGTGPQLDPAIGRHAGLESWLPGGGRPVHDGAVGDGEGRSVPGAGHAGSAPLNDDPSLV